METTNTVAISGFDSSNRFVECDYCLNDNEDKLYFVVVDTYETYNELFICEEDMEDALKFIKNKFAGVKIAIEGGN